MKLVPLHISSKYTSLHGNFRPEKIPALIDFMAGCIAETQDQKPKRIYKPRKKKPKDMSIAAQAKRVIAGVRAMTPAERVKSMVDVGIIHPDGTLTKEYGGPGSE